MAVDDQAKLSFGAVTELTKQLITLGTGVLTLEVAFAKAFVEKQITQHWQIQASWVLLLVSLVAGVWVLMAVAGSLAKGTGPAAADIYNANVRGPAFLQVLTFVAGMGFTVWFGLIASS